MASKTYSLGSIIEMDIVAGHCYVQPVHEYKYYGPLYRVFPGLYSCPLPDPA